MRLGLDEVFIHWVSTLGICLCFHTAAIYAGCWMQYTYLQGGSSALWEYLPSLDKSTYGFCGHKYPPDIARCVDRRQPACRSALPRTPFLPRKNSTGLFCEGKSGDDKEENAGILAYATAGPRKVVRPRGERRSDEALEGCLFRRNSAPT